MVFLGWIRLEKCEGSYDWYLVTDFYWKDHNQEKKKQVCIHENITEVQK